MFILGLVIGFLLGVTGLHLAWSKIYIKNLEHVANLAVLIIETKNTENERMKELRQAVDSLRAAALKITGERVN